MLKEKTPRSGNVSLARLQEKYNLTDPQQIQMRIIFNLLLAVVESQYGSSKENLKISAGYRKQWRVLEKSTFSTSNRTGITRMSR
jgi:hypothetical protein